MVVGTPLFVFFSPSHGKGWDPWHDPWLQPGGPEKADRGGEEELVEGTHRQILGGEEKPRGDEK